MNKYAIIILGATGDLSRHKIFPALYRLFIENKLNDSIIIGAALDDVDTAGFMQIIKTLIKPEDEKQWQQFIHRVSYLAINFTQEEDFKKLEQFVSAAEKKVKLSGNRIVYCATAPYFYCTITHGLAKSGLVKKGINQRIVYEKPFGNDLASAHEINECISQYFQEDQIFRIDHYLTKELVGNIALVRFTNIVFEPLWNNRYIDQVQIVFD